MSVRWSPDRVFVYRRAVDMRKQIDGLSALVTTELGHDPADRSAYVFVSRCRRRVKVLIWHLNGYWLLYERLEAQRFHWPDRYRRRGLDRARQRAVRLPARRLRPMRHEAASRSGICASLLTKKPADIRVAVALTSLPVNAAAHKHEQDELAALRAKLAAAEAALEQAQKRFGGKERMIERLEQRIRELVQARWGRSSEKHPGQSELSLFNEAELAAMDIGAADEDILDEDAGSASPADAAAPTKPTTQPRRKRELPDGLERVRIVHGLDAAELRSSCGGTMVPIGEEITEQLGILPQRHFVLQHVKIKYACSCKACGVKIAAMPTPPIPGSQASPGLLSWSMVGKYHDCTRSTARSASRAPSASSCHAASSPGGSSGHRPTCSRRTT